MIIDNVLIPGYFTIKGCREDVMQRTVILLTLFTLLSSAAAFADGEKSAKEGFKEIHQGMKKVTKAVDKNAKKGAKTIDRNAKKTWKKAGHDVKKATKG